MAQGRCSAMLAVALLLVCAASVVQGATYFVGGTYGWAVPGSNSAPTTYLTDWAANQTFVAGDSVVFMYNSAAHNVLTVNQAAYTDCTLTTPLNSVKTGNDSIILGNGVTYFICGVPGHCLGGQKVAINATAAAPGTPGTPPATPGTPPSTPGTTPATTPPNAAAENTATVVQVLAAVAVSLVVSVSLW